MTAENVPLAFDREPTRAEVEQLKGPFVLEFGAAW